MDTLACQTSAALVHLKIFAHAHSSLSDCVIDLIGNLSADFEIMVVGNLLESLGGPGRDDCTD